ncbi:hypothetical protein H1191_09855 [Paenactinomyces guangxiensis]|uniref:Uncharacterized protein n=1 Tax=Paenactinomyces guangxiensis TaxID=1490290 RepID=A0A7W1WRI8_9BACL|nr:hypothetical protein [Paenactinomyces guangxiensis]MBH8591628.1 hypothetical protein [Paenactinomyces guangxiensis]
MFISTCSEDGTGEEQGKGIFAEVQLFTRKLVGLGPYPNRSGTVTEATAFVEGYLTEKSELERFVLKTTASYSLLWSSVFL